MGGCRGGKKVSGWMVRVIRMYCKHLWNCQRSKQVTRFRKGEIPVMVLVRGKDGVTELLEILGFIISLGFSLIGEETTMQ